MKNFLNTFMDECAYEKDDKEFLLQSYEKIANNEEAFKIFNDAIALYNEDTYKDFNPEIIPMAEKAGEIADVHIYTSGLLIFMCLAKQLKELYIKNNISLDIYHETVLDLRYKLEECKAVRGIVGSFVATWFPGFFALTRFGLGRMQFEVIKFEKEYCKDGKTLTPGTPVINVHIPRTGTPLDKESCDAAYQMAKEFFKEEVPSGAFVCISWLLYPEHKNILSPKSNVYRFMSEYDILFSEDYYHGEALWRLFDTDERNPYRLPTNGSLRKAYVDHLKKGGKTGWAYGVQFR